MKVKGIAECSLGALCNIFRPALSDDQSREPIFGIFEWPLKTGLTVYSVQYNKVDFKCEH